MKGNLSALLTLLSQPVNIVITSHQKPDGDAMGSSLGLYHYLKLKGHHVKVVLPTEFPQYFNWMQGMEDVHIYPDEKEACDTFINNAALIGCLDFNTLSRVAPVDEAIKAAGKPILLIDHHQQPDEFDWMLHDTGACSTCELVYRFIHILEERPELTPEMAQCLYTGILTDTGSFQNGATNEAAFRIVADLIQSGLQIQYVQEQLNQNGSESRLRFIGNSLLNKMHIYKEYGLAIIVVDKKDAKRFNLSTGDTEGLVNFPLSIREIQVSVLIKEERSLTKLSFRSKGDWDANVFARTHFEGGGHKNAAGGKSIFPPDWIIKKLLELFEKKNKKVKA